MLLKTAVEPLTLTLSYPTVAFLTLVRVTGAVGVADKCNNTRMLEKQVT